MDTDRQLGPGQVAAVVHLLKLMVHEEADELADEDRRGVGLSGEYFRQGGEGLFFEQVIADLGFPVDQWP